MDIVQLGLGALGGIAVGALVAYLYLRERHAAKMADAAREAAAKDERLAAEQQRVKERDEAAAAMKADAAVLRSEILAERREHAEARAEIARLKTEVDKDREAHASKLAALAEAEARLERTFQALAAGALSSNSQQFLQLAQQTLSAVTESAKGDLDRRREEIAGIVAPVRESLGRFEEKINSLEQVRTTAYAGLMEQVASLREGHRELRTETGNLVRALRAPQVRGRWGEMQLRRVVEIAGMVEHCDFVEQATRSGEDGRVRPDVIVRLPGGKTLIVDAKAPLAAYLEAIEAQDEGVRREKMAHHARQVRDHIKQLSAKAYWNQFQPTPEFVVLFLPGEMLFSAALQHDPDLFEAGVDSGVIMASPATLIALLRSAAYGWRQEGLARHAEEISELGRELHKRLAKLAEHWARLGKSLGSAVGAYNDAVGSLETRVLAAGRRFRELKAAAGEAEIPAIATIDQQPRRLQAPELLEAQGRGDPAES